MKARQRFEVEAVRKDFPVLAQGHRSGKPLVYLDSAASSQKPQSVIDRVVRYYAEENANVHRGMHYLAELATEAYEGARKRTASWLNTASEREIIFTRGTTESINLVAHAYGRKHLSKGDVVVLSEMEHHSNLVPWQLLKAERGVVLKFIPVTDAGALDLEVFQSILDAGGVRFVSVMHASNVLGTINPVEEIIEKAHAVGAVVLLDVAQSVPHLALDVQALDVDFLAFSGHKMCGPTGIGVLYGKEALLEEMHPFLGGGEMISKVELHESTWADLPYKFEAGTPNMAGAIGLAEAIHYLEGIGLASIEDYVHELSAYTVKALNALSGVNVHGEAIERSGAVSFSVEGIHPHDVSQILDEQGIGIRAGHLCCQPLMKRLGVPAVCRASVYLYSSREEVDLLVDGLCSVQRLFGFS